MASIRKKPSGSYEARYRDPTGACSVRPFGRSEKRRTSSTAPAPPSATGPGVTRRWPRCGFPSTRRGGWRTGPSCARDP